MISQELLPRELVSLIECSVELHLTGSRFFGYNKEKSDYDFFCADTKANREELIRVLKWMNLTHQDDPWLNTSEINHFGFYDDKNTTETWRHFGTRYNIDVQFVKDVNMKIDVQQHLKDFPFPHLDKKFRSLIWDWAYRKLTKEKREKEESIQAALIEFLQDRS